MKLEVKNISKSFGNLPVVKDVSFTLQSNSILSVLGKSGCGKTTLLKCLAGLETSESGEIYLNSHPIHSLPPQQRNVVYIYQETLLFPHLSVFENIAFGLRIRKIAESELKNRVSEMLRRLGLSAKAQAMPHELSGGQAQRVSFGRALIINPGVLLLDEPFGNLDSQTRSEMQQFFLEIISGFNITAIFVTHDLKEALLTGSELALMEHGNLHIFQSKQAFIEDPRTGARNEIGFWQSSHLLS